MSTTARDLIEAERNELIFSSASLWEIVIKRGLGREDLKVDPRLLRRGLLDNGYTELWLRQAKARSIAPRSVVAAEAGGRIRACLRCAGAQSARGR